MKSPSNEYITNLSLEIQEDEDKHDALDIPEVYNVGVKYAELLKNSIFRKIDPFEAMYNVP